MANRHPEGAAACADHPPPISNPLLEITPSPAEYDQLCRDLATLREAGAESNTAAVLAAVSLAAAGSLGRVK